ncbi:MAG: ATP-dependent helicase [Kiritimatiellaeota bacterium]|nr:ATP-dependent helicase [Kiritimatiellota bacterium]
MTLTAEQREALALREGRHVVVAPPGTGKTEVLALRMTEAVARGEDVGGMACVAFTAKAAQAMRERLEGERPREPRLTPWIGTIHQLCHRIIKEAGTPFREWEIIDEADRDDILWETIASLPEAIQREVADADGTWPLARLGRGVRGQGLGRGVRGQGLGVSEGTVAVIATAFRLRKAALKVLDFDDLLTEALATLKTAREDCHCEGRSNRPPCVMSSTPSLEGERPREPHTSSGFRKIAWLQVDEAQDVEAAQWEILEAACEPNAHCVFFGDPDQAIFGFRGASWAHLQNAMATCPVHTLSTCFRMNSYLLDIMVRYAVKNLSPRWTRLPQPGKIQRRRKHDVAVVQCAVEEAQAAWMARKIAAEFAKGTVIPTAIMAHSNEMAIEVAEALETARVPHYLIAEDDLFMRPEMRDFMAYCRAACGRGGRWTWVRLFRRFGRTGSFERAAAIVHDLAEEGITPERLTDRLFASRTAGQGRAMEAHWREIASFRETFGTLWRRVVESPEERTTYRDLFEAFVRDTLRWKLYDVEHLNFERGERPEAMILLRAERFLRYADRRYETLCQTMPFTEVLRQTWREVGRLTEADTLVGDEPVVVSTIHKAKGMEFERVMVPLCQDTVFPGRPSRHDAAESARLLYVAMSRARTRLLLLYSGTLSRFLSPIRDDIERDHDVYRRQKSLLRFFRRRDWLRAGLLTCLKKTF